MRMATAIIPSKQLVLKDTECPICFEKHVTQRCLPCAHVFCLNCLQKYGEHQREGNRMSCPLCRHMFSVPFGGFDKLADTLLAAQTLERDIQSSRMMSEQVPLQLEQHKVIAGTVSRNRELQLQLSKCLLSSHSELHQLEIDRKRLLKNTSTTLQNISTASENIKRLVDTQSIQLVEQIESFRDSELKNIDAKQETIRKHLPIIEAHKQSESLTSGREATCEDREAESGNILEVELARAEEMLRCNKVRNVEVSFMAASWLQDVTSGRIDLIGQLTFLELNRLVSSSTIKAHRLARLEPGGEVRGLAQLHQQIYVICDKSNTIRIYDARSFKRLNGITTKKDKTLHPADIAACRTNECLYVSDRHNRCVWRIEEDGHKVDKLIKSIKSSSMISATADGRLLIPRYEPPTFDMFGEESSTLGVYESTGHLLYSVPLPNDMKDLQHAVMMSAGNNFIISHGDKGSLHRVCEVTRSGRVVRSYGGLRGSGNGQLNCPKHIALDTSGRVYVTDYNNDRVVVLDARLNLYCYLCTDETDIVHQPTTLSYCNEGNRELLVIGLRSGHADVYIISESS